MRTCSIVHFNLPVPSWLQETHNKIYNGGSIGQTIKENQFNLLKEDLFLGTSELSNFAKEKMDTDETTAAVHIYKLIVSNPETSILSAYFRENINRYGVFELSRSKNTSALEFAIKHA